MHREETTRKRFALQSISALALLCFAVSGWEHDIAYDANAPLLHAPEFTPTPVPDRLILTWTGDPSRSQAVTWRTSADVKEGIGEIAIAGVDTLVRRPANGLRFDGLNAVPRSGPHSDLDHRPRKRPQ